MNEEFLFPELKNFFILKKENKVLKKAGIYIPQQFKITKFDTKLTFREVARYLNISSRTLVNLRIKNFAHIKLSKRKFYYLERDVLEFVNKNYFPPQIVDEEEVLPPLTIKDKLLALRDVLEFFKKTTSPSLIKQYRIERKLGYIRLSSSMYRYPERDLLNFINKNYKNRLSYE